MTEERQKVNRTTMMAPKVPGGITVKQPTTLKQQQTARKQSEVAKKYLEAEQARAKAEEEKANSKVRRSPAEKRLHSESNVTGGAAATDDDQPVIPFKRARRSDEARASPRKFELDSSDLSAQRASRKVATASEFLRLKGRPVNAKGPAKMAPMGKLRFFVKETIGGRKGGAEGGYIDDVENGVRLVVNRTLKDLSYQALRQKSIAKEMIVDKEEEEAAGDAC